MSHRTRASIEIVLLVCGSPFIAPACSSGAEVGSNPGDLTSNAPEVDLHCDVVWADQTVSQLEEGFGALYDIDEDGFSLADEDSEKVDVDTEDGALTVWLGQDRFDPADGAHIDAEPVEKDATWRGFVVVPSGSAERYTVRVFANQLGVLRYQASPAADAARLATLDCRGVLEEAPAESDVAKMSSCSVVSVNAEVNGKTLEEGLASIYDVDDDGFFISDEDATAVRIDGATGERSIQIGLHAFSEENADSITVEDVDEALTYVIRPKDSDELFSVRIFRHANDAEIPGIGMVLYQETPDAAPESLAVLDCRGIAPPDEVM